MVTGTIKSQVDLQMLEAKWEKKKHEINSKKKEPMTKDEMFMKSLNEQAEATRKGNQTSDIYNKLKSGGKLTAEEIAYLKENDPEALADYEKAQAEKKAYEKELKNCKTKEEVDRLKLNKLGTFAAEAKNIANNPYIPKEKKLELMNKLNNRVCCLRDAHDKFVKSRAYKELPEEAKLNEEQIEETVARNDEVLVEHTDENEVATDSAPEDNEKQSFEQVNQEIDDFLRKNSSDKSSFEREV